MSYLIAADYAPLIQDVNLQQVISATPSIKAGAELTAQQEAISFLRQKYEVDSEFTDTAVWSPANTFNAGNRIYLDAAAYNTGTSYNSADLTLHNGGVYYCVSPTTGAFDPTKWSLQGNQYAIFYAKYPKPIFDYNGVYKKGDQVFWKNKTYTNIIPTDIIGHDAALQINKLQNIPTGNVFPNDPNNGLQSWGAGSAYSIPIHVPVTSTTYWVAADNRDAQMVQKLIEITLFHLHKRIAPRNTPQLRISAYMGEEKDRGMSEQGEIIYPVYSALGWLQACARGFVTPALPLIQPRQGNRIRYGGTVPSINTY